MDALRDVSYYHKPSKCGYIYSINSFSDPFSLRECHFLGLYKYSVLFRVIYNYKSNIHLHGHLASVH